MLYQSNLATILIFLFFILFVLGLSFSLGRKAQSAKGYYAAHGQIGFPFFSRGAGTRYILKHMTVPLLMSN